MGLSSQPIARKYDERGAEQPITMLAYIDENVGLDEEAPPRRSFLGVEMALGREIGIDLGSENDRHEIC